MQSQDYFLTASIKAVADKYGGLSLDLFSGNAEKFSDLEYVFIDVFGGKRKFIVEDFEVINKVASIKFLNFDSVSDVKFLIGKDIYVDNEKWVESDEFFIDDLIGCDVFFKNEFFGKVVDLENYPGNDVISVEKPDGSVLLLPFVSEFFGNIDIEKRKLILKKTIEFTDDED